jgi:hypothetical protein
LRMIRFHSSSWLSKTPLCINTQRKYHIFFTHSSVVRHLGCFHNLAIVNSTFQYINFTQICKCILYSWYCDYKRALLFHLQFYSQVSLSRGIRVKNSETMTFRGILNARRGSRWGSGDLAGLGTGLFIGSAFLGHSFTCEPWFVFL